jgi:hypothetical protein
MVSVCRKDKKASTLLPERMSALFSLLLIHPGPSSTAYLSQQMWGTAGQDSKGSWIHILRQDAPNGYKVFPPALSV